MPGFLRQSTASQSRALGPFLDDTDFKTAETALTIANTDIKLMANGAASANKTSGGGTHRVNGMYGVTWDATDTATVGSLKVSVVVAGALPVFDEYTVLEETIYDALFAASATGYLQPTVAARTLDVSAGGEAGIDWANIGSPTTAVNLSATNIDPDQIVASVSGAVGSVAPGGITAASIATGAIDADAIATDAVTEIQAGLATAAALATVQADTDNLQTRLPTALTAGGNMKTDSLYAMGRVWLDTLSGVAGTTAFTHGVLTNPNSSMANARTIATAQNLTAFEVRNGSSITLDQGYVGFTFLGEKWTLALANRAITNSFFAGADVSGLSTGAGARFFQCILGNVTIADAAIFSRCGLNGTFTIGSAGSFVFEACFSATAAGTDTVLDFAALGATTVGMRAFHGAIEIRNMAAGDVLTIMGAGKITIAASCTAGTVRIDGAFSLINNGAATITDTARWDESQSIASVGAIGANAITATALDPTAGAEIAAAVWDQATTGHTTAGTFGEQAKTDVDAILAAVDTEIAAIKAKTDNLPADPADASDLAASFATVNTKLDTVSAAVDTEVAAIKVVTDKLDDTLVDQGGGVYGFTEAALQEAPGGGTGGTTDWDATERAQIRKRLGLDGTASAPVATPDLALQSTVAAIQAKTNALPTDPADASDIAASFTTVNTKLDTVVAAVDTEIAAIKAKTDALPADPADASDLAASFATVNTKLDTVTGYVDTEVAAILAKVNALPADPADASDLAAAFAGVNTKLDTLATYVDTEVAAIKVKTDALPSDPADQSAVEAAITAALTTAVADSVPADGTRPSIAQALYMIVQILTEKSVSGTTMTVHKPDGSTALLTFTLNDATAPTAITRAS